MTDARVPDRFPPPPGRPSGVHPGSVMRARALGLLAMAALPLMGGCAPEEERTGAVDQEEVARALTPEARVQLDSANAAYRDEAYEAALGYFRQVAEMAPDEATGWFGIYMAQTALGNVEAAQEALQQARSLAPGASLIRDTVPEGS